MRSSRCSRNQFVNVRLLLRTIPGAIVAPVAALRNGSKGDFVYVLNMVDHTAALRPVNARPSQAPTKVEITAAWQVGEKIITEGADRLKDGAKVTLGRRQTASRSRPRWQRKRQARRGAGGDGDGRLCLCHGCRCAAFGAMILKQSDGRHA